MPPALVPPPAGYTSDWQVYTPGPAVPQPSPAQAAGRPGVRARYENAVTTPENQRNWWAADYLSAKAANSFGVRRTLRVRSRHEFGNNPFLFGICSGNADDAVGTGPTPQVRTASEAYNREVERAWADWWAEVDGLAKVRTCKLAKTVDGEGFLVLKTVGDMEHPVKLYPCDVEADQVTTAAPQSLSELWVDGLDLHPVTGRPVFYHVLRNHPGDFFFAGLNPLAADKVSARHVIHWFDQFRPGQVRGVPTFSASLDLFAELRAFRRAVVRAAETAADFSAVLEQELGTAFGDDEDDAPELAAFKRVPISRGMMAALPPGAKLSQLEAVQPTTTYQTFAETCLGEAVRPMGYPLNLALGTSQKFNFSSAKLDHINYRNSLTVERGRCETAVLRRLFAAWYEEAVLCGALRAWDGLRLPPVEWHWPGFESLDPLSDAQTDSARLAGGTMTCREYWARRGRDWKEVFAQLAAEKREMERLGLSFGDVVKRSVTEAADPKQEPANAA